MIQLDMATRKDYKRTAARIKNIIEDINNNRPTSKQNTDNIIKYVKTLAEGFADDFKTDNCRFDRDLFMSAAGFDPETR